MKNIVQQFIDRLDKISGMEVVDDACAKPSEYLNRFSTDLVGALRQHGYKQDATRVVAIMNEEDEYGLGTNKEHFWTRCEKLSDMLAVLLDAIDEPTHQISRSITVKAESIPSRAAPQNSRVFVVHGRNLQARDAVFAFLGSIGLQPLEWAEAVKMTTGTNPFIGDVLNTALNNAQAIVVLMTPDDLACLDSRYVSEADSTQERDLTPQPRQNVLFEAGMAMGRCPERTVLVQIGALREFSDISGRHVLRLSDSTEKRQDFVDRLKKAGCPVNIDGRRWHTAGNFEQSLGDPISGKLPTATNSSPQNASVPKCPNCSSLTKPFYMSPLPKDFLELEGVNYGCSKCNFTGHF